MNDAPTFANRALGDDGRARVFSQDYDSRSLPNANVMEKALEQDQGDID